MKETNGNLIDLFFENEFDAIIHGCNCKRNFGAGIAKEIKQRIPEAYKADLKSNPDSKHNIPSTYSFAKTNHRTVINLYSQKHWGKPSKHETAEDRYFWIRTGLRQINKDFAGKSIGLPLIGCGYAGLNWSKVKKIINESLTNCEVTIVHYE